MRRRYIFLLLFLLSAGCLSNTPARIQAPKWDPDSAADNAMGLDTDGDGLLSSKELKTGAPGLLAALGECDVDKDKKLSREEVLARIQLYQETRTGLLECRCKVTYKGRPLANAEVRFVPESFLGDSITGGYGETRPDGTVTMGLEDSVEPFVKARHVSSGNHIGQR